MEEDERDKPWNFHTCKSCSYRSKSAFQMCRHVRMHRRRSKTDTFICDSETPEMFECEFCGFETNLRVDLTEHFRVFHEEKEANEELQNILKCYRCKNCNFVTHSVLVLAKHLADHQENKFSLSKNEFTSSKGFRSYKCTKCAFRTKQKGNLKYHIKAKHTHPEDISWFECDKCAYKAKKGSHLKIHVLRKHTNAEDVSWFKCGQCAFKSKEKSYLKMHTMYKHTSAEDISWYKCGQCSYQSVKKQDLKRHITNKHASPEDVSLFKCSQCEFKCKLKHGLKRHLRVMHSIREDIPIP